MQFRDSHRDWTHRASLDSITPGLRNFDLKVNCRDRRRDQFLRLSGKGRKQKRGTRSARNHRKPIVKTPCSERPRSISRVSTIICQRREDAGRDARIAGMVSKSCGFSVSRSEAWSVETLLSAEIGLRASLINPPLLFDYYFPRADSYSRGSGVEGTATGLILTLPYYRGFIPPDARVACVVVAFELATVYLHGGCGINFQRIAIR